MRLIRLVMSAFGSYAGEEIIEFDQNFNGIFLIAGDTGSGKTTIFDAVIYALYGKTSGGNRDGNMMRSQYAKAEVPTFVQLVFEYGGEEYCIKRNPEYERPSKRKNADGTLKTTSQKSDVSLIMPDGSEFQGKKTEIDAKIIEITGLDADQFAQVAMIAQGDFMRFLYADSGTRRGIFSKIFKTGNYGRIQEALKNKSKSISAELEDIRKIYSDRLKNVRTLGETSADNVKALEELINNSAPDWNKAPELIEELVKEQKTRSAGLEEKHQKLQKALTDINSAYERYTDAKKRYDASAEKESELLSWLETASGQLEEMQADFALIKEKADREEPELRLFIAQINESIPKYKSMQEKFAQAMEADKKAAKLAKQLDAQEADAVSQRAKSDEIAKYQEENKDCRLKEQEVRSRAESTGTLLESIKELAQREKELASFEKTAREAAALYEEALEEYQEAAKEYDRIERIFMSEQAGLLAQQLEEGKPCPVCGSSVHPAPCERVSGEVTQSSVKKAKKKRDDADSKRGEAMEKSVAASGKYKSSREALERDKQKAGLSEDDILLRLDELDAQVKALKAENKRLSDIVRIYNENENKLKGYEESIKKLEKEAQQTRQELSDANIKAAELNAQYNAMKENLEFESAEEAGRSLDDAKERLSLSEQKLKEAQKAVQSLNDDITGKKAEAGSEKTRKENLQKEYENLKADFDRTLEDNGFTSWQQDVRDELQNNIEKISSEYNEIYSSISVNEEIIESLKALNRKWEHADSEYAVYDTLYKTAGGHLSGSAKMDFETYVLRKYFVEIINAANHRLSGMNDGQWRLKCRNISELANNRQAGLDLDVHDEITNTSRNVKTLSGGETFMAALAMALGMADIIQNRVGLVRLDTMFIDEGFGSLDDYSRQQAIGVLNRLAGENCAIGIISHVAELKEQIEKQLIVTKTGRGSSARWK